MRQPRWVWMPLVCVLGALLAGGARTHGAELDNTTKSAVYLLKTSMEFHQDRRHMQMLRALRQLHDPALSPFFSALKDSKDPEFKIHGILGLADCDPKRLIDPIYLQEVKEAGIQWTVLSEAMDQGLLSVEQAKEIIKWELDERVKVVLATFLIRHKEVVDLEMLRTASQSNKIALASLATMLLVQSGDEAAAQQLQALNQSTDPKRDAVREQLLRTAFKSEFEKIGPWALTVATESDLKTDPRLRHLAVQVALRFGTPGAMETWQQMFGSAIDKFESIRLALVALNVSPWADPKLYTPLLENDDEVLRAIGETGTATASHQNVAETVIKAIQLKQTQVNEWAVDYAREKADDQDAQAILKALIDAVEGPGFGRAGRLLHAVQAAATLAERYPQTAMETLRPILANPETNTWLVRGILSALLQCEKTDPFPIIDGLEPFKDNDAKDLALMIRARFGHPLSDDQLRALELLVQGAGRFELHMRLQAAWIYLQRTDKTRLALTEVTR